MNRCDRCGKFITMTEEVYSGCGNPDVCECRYCAECAEHKHPTTSVRIERGTEYTEADALWDAR
jgi:hypothetical protein